MAKNSIRDFSATAGSNTDIQSVNIDENCPASGINNAIRELMVDLKNVSTGAVNLETPAADQLNVDNLRIDGNTISSTDTNGDITLDPNGTGDTIIASGNVGIGTNSPSNFGGTTLQTNHGTTYSANLVSSGAYILQMLASEAQGAMSIGSRSNHHVAFTTNDTERMRVDSSGNVGIGRSPVAKLDAYLGSGVGGLAVGVSGASTTILDSDLIQLRGGSGTERMRLNSSGQLAINNDGTFRSNEKLTVKNSTDTSAMWCTAASGSVNMLSMYRGSGQTFVGSVETTGSATQYVSASDHRLKENVVDLTGAIDRLKTLSPRRFNFIAEPDTTLDGFIAHEVTACPEAVSGTHNAVDDDGNPKYQGLDASKLVPLLTGALQEAIAKIETLETQRADLETRLTALEA